MSTIAIQDAQKQLMEIIHRLAPGDELSLLKTIVQSRAFCLRTNPWNQSLVNPEHSAEPCFT
ncbi:MAG: hypothetical protein ACREHD_07595, partial [Pirellulales bacterium]